jgi:hypothetical protein
MTTSATSQTIVCATCDLWGGPREAMQPYPSLIVSYDCYSKGKCMGGIFSPHEVSCIASCAQWRKWGALKSL